MSKEIKSAFSLFYKDARIVTFSIFYAVILALHTLMNQSWKSLMREISKQGSNYNGLILGISLFLILYFFFIFLYSFYQKKKEQVMLQVL